MAGTIAADTLTHSTAGSIATNFVVEGSAKVWNFATQPSATIQDSFNVASMVDNGTGLMTHNFVNNMGNGLYPTQLSLTNNVNQWWVPNSLSTTTSLQSRTYTGSSYTDQDHCIAVHGDLA